MRICDKIDDDILLKRGKNDFGEISKNLAGYRSAKIIISDHQSNYVGRSSIMSNAVKKFDILATSLSVLHNYFDGLTKLFSDLYQAKFLEFSKNFVQCV